MMNRKGIVYFNNIKCGIIEETDSGYIFKYDIEYISMDNSKAISLTMPLTTQEYFSEVLFPFFDGLIPEGWLLEIVISKWNIRKSDRMGLLLAVCEDTIGAVSIKGVL